MEPSLVDVFWSKISTATSPSTQSSLTWIATLTRPLAGMVRSKESCSLALVPSGENRTRTADGLGDEMDADNFKSTGLAESFLSHKTPSPRPVGRPTLMTGAFKTFSWETW